MNVSKTIAPSVAGSVREVIENDLSLQDALQRGYANVSGVARVIKPLVERSVGRKVSLQTLITSVKRLRTGYRELGPGVNRVVAGSKIAVKTDIAKLAVTHSPQTVRAAGRLLSHHQGEFLQASQGLSSITMIFNQDLLEEVRRAFAAEALLELEAGLAAIILNSPRSIVETPGCVAAFCNQISRRHLNIEDIVSCHTETIIVVKMEAVGPVFAALTEMIARARTQSSPERKGGDGGE